VPRTRTIEIWFCLLACCCFTPLSAETLLRPDSSAIHYYLDEPEAPSYPLVVILQGSECLRVSDKYTDYIERVVAGGAAALRVEKPGLHSGVAPGDCPDEYLRLNTPQRRVLDLVMVVSELRRNDSWDGRLVLLGGSEGAMIAAMTAPLLPETRGVVLMSGGGGLTFGEEVVESAGRQMLDSGLDPKKVEEEKVAMRGFLAGLAQNPTPYEEWGSDGELARNTYLWWAHAVRLRLSNSLQRVEAPILILHGLSDEGTPFRSAEILMEELKFAGKSGVQFRSYDGGHSPPPEEIQEALNWALQRLGN
jgi:pimeloyl-ACP methyl ester carboxylesterase